MAVIQKTAAAQLTRRKSGFQILLDLYRDDLPKLFLSFLCYIVKTSPIWLMPLLIAQVITVITTPQQYSLGTFFLYIFLIMVVILQNIPTHYWYYRLLSTATRNMERRLRSDIIKRLHHLSMHFYSRIDMGTLQSKLLRDVEMIEQLTKQLFEGILGGAIFILAAVIITGIAFPWFLLFYLIVAPAGLILFSILKKPLQRHNTSFRKEVEAVSARMSEMLHLIPLIRAHGTEEDEIERIDKNLSQVQAAGLLLDRHTAATNSSSWVTFRLFDALCLGTAGYIAFTHVWPLSVASVILLTGYFRNFIDAAVNVVGTIPQLSKGWESLYSVQEILDEDDLEYNEGKQKVTTVAGHFVFDRAGFTYPGAPRDAFAPFDLDVLPGTTVAIVGHSGSGKTTLMNLIIGFLRPSEGRIWLDGVDMNELDLRTYRQRLGVVSQETLLFKGTIRDNITFGVADLDPQHFQQVVQDANVQEFVEALPNGYDTMIGENGARLSGGQRQRIAIARALFRNPRVLVLDEATSGLDAESEASVKEALERLMEGRTTFVVAHHLSTIRNADVILVLDRGRVVEMGDHQKLLSQDGVYARFWALGKRQTAS
jgi:ATP-binding cassette, subfamily B, bacterial